MSQTFRYCLCAFPMWTGRVPGGSAANVMKGLANISAGQALCKFMGMVGQDTTAADYKEMLQQQGVQPVLLVSCHSCSLTTAAGFGHCSAWGV